MSRKSRNLLSNPDVLSHLENIYTGYLSWDLVHPFPRQTDVDHKHGSTLVAEVLGMVTAEVDADELDRTGRLPASLIDGFRSRGYLALRTPPEEGGHGLSDFNAFRVIEAVAGHSPAVALILAIDNAIGLGALQPVLAAGPLRDEVRRRLLTGVVTASADTEPSGAANFRRATTATPVDGGAAYLLSGEKVHIGNGPIAEMLSVSATVRDGAGEPTRMFVVDAGSPGLEVVGRHEFMGLKGFPNGAFRFADVRVPAERMFVERPREHQTRITPEVTAMVLHGRMYLIAAPSLAISRRCAEFSRDFANRRTIDGKPLGAYEKVQRLLAQTLADTFAVDAVARWCLLAGRGEHGGPAGVNAVFEQNAAKNITSVLCWRIVDRTMSLLAGEGLETAGSKAARGAPALPLERLYRDARALRISGGVDFQIDYWTAQMGILSYYYPAPPDERVLATGRDSFAVIAGAGLGERNTGHARAVQEGARRLARTCLDLSRRYPQPAELYAREQTLLLLSRWANELFTMSAVLGRAADLTTAGDDDGQLLADVYCTGARHRLAGIDRRLAATDEPDHGRLSAMWLAGAEPAGLLGNG